MSIVWGVMQGRFTDKGGFYPQQFPWDAWKQEFYTAGKYGIDCMEWMFNAERYEDNPVWTDNGRKEIADIVQDSGVGVGSICANYYMEHSLLADEAADILDRLLDAGEELGARHIVLPLFGASGIEDADTLSELSDWVGTRLLGRDIRVCLETDMPVDFQLAACDRSGGDRIGVCYDVGNAAGRGCDYADDLSKISRGGGITTRFISRIKSSTGTA